MLILRFCVHTVLIQDKRDNITLTETLFAVLETFKLIQHATSGKIKLYCKNMATSTELLVSIPGQAITHKMNE